MAVKMIPEGYHTVQPFLIVEGAKRLLDFVRTVFDASEVQHMSASDGRVMHAEQYMAQKQ